jgi:hypothetical protein
MELETMDRETKGLVSDCIDNLIEQKNLTDKTNWALEAIKTHYLLKPKETDKMLTLAYILGSGLSSISDVVFDRKRYQKLIEINYKSMVKNLGKEEADKFQAELIMTKGRKGKPLTIKVTEEDYDYIKSKLIPIIAQLEIKINQEQALKKVKGKE